jgi:hypothetical protein
VKFAMILRRNQLVLHAIDLDKLVFTGCLALEFGNLALPIGLGKLLVVQIPILGSIGAFNRGSIGSMTLAVLVPSLGSISGFNRRSIGSMSLPFWYHHFVPSAYSTAGPSVRWNLPFRYQCLSPFTRSIAGPSVR